MGKGRRLVLPGGAGGKGTLPTNVRVSALEHNLQRLGELHNTLGEAYNRLASQQNKLTAGYMRLVMALEKSGAVDLDELEPGLKQHVEEARAAIEKAKQEVVEGGKPEGDPS
jgi:hypothetical protein